MTMTTGHLSLATIPPFPGAHLCSGCVRSGVYSQNFKREQPKVGHGEQEKQAIHKRHKT